MPHIHEKIDFTAEAFVVYKDKVLLRMHDKFKIWLSVGGHIELDEDPNQAVLREVKEEVGLDVELIGKKTERAPLEENQELLPPRYLLRHRVNPTHEHVTFVYFAKTKSDIINIQHESDRSDDCVWATLEDLDKMDLVPNVRAYAIEALKELSQ